MDWALLNANLDDGLAERSKAVAQGAIPKGRGFEPHRCHFAHALTRCGAESHALNASDYLDFAWAVCVQGSARPRLCQTLARKRDCNVQFSQLRPNMTAVGFEPTPLRTGAWSQRLRPLGQTV